MDSAARAAPLVAIPRASLVVAGLVGLVELLLVIVGWKLGTFAWPMAGSLAMLFAILAYRAPEAAWLLTWAATVLSAEVTIPGGFAVALPTEPMMGIALLAWLARRWPWGDLSRGPASIARPLAALAAIALLSVATSRFPLIGAKAWIMAGLSVAFGYLYFVSVGYRTRRVTLWLGVAVAVGSLVSLYASLRLFSTGINLGVAYGASRPFFTEHGTYAAYLALLLPPALFESLAPDRPRRILWAAGAGMLLVGLALSYTRAAWLSVLFAVPIGLGLWSVARGSVGRLWVPIAIVAAIVVGLAGTGIGDRLWRHAGTIFASDNVSNLERLNRWMAALEMTKAHPWTGVGYGVYPEAYREYRRKTIVTEQSYGRYGAHNELLRMLSETGWPGLALSVWFVAAVGVAGIRAFLRSPHSDPGRLALGLTCGLATYAVHAIFNSYLGIDKISVPFWIFVGMIASIAALPDGAEPTTDSSPGPARRSPEPTP